MGDKTGIEWTDATWNPLAGCSRVSAGCLNCYAERTAHRFSTTPSSPYFGTTRIVNGRPTFVGRMNLNENALDLPLRWRRPRRIFVNSMSDLFHENVPDRWIAAVFAIMAASPRHTFQVLTKRPERAYLWFDRVDKSGGARDHMHEALKGVMGYDNPLRPAINNDAWPLPNVWLGVSVEDQEAANVRIPQLLLTPAALRFLSCEPLLGPVDVSGHLSRSTRFSRPGEEGIEFFHGIDWVIAGGESGPGARPMRQDWTRSLRDQCAAANVPFFFKQWGEWLPGQNDVDPTDSQGRRVAHHQDGRWGPTETRPLNAKNYIVWDASGCSHKGSLMHVRTRFDVSDWAERVGKKAAGRKIDDREHNEFPT